MIKARDDMKTYRNRSAGEKAKDADGVTTAVGGDWVVVGESVEIVDMLVFDGRFERANSGPRRSSGVVHGNTRKTRKVAKKKCCAKRR